jgi:hypothetical protein
MNLARLEAELKLLILDKSLFPRFRQWINDAITEIAADFELPTLRTRTPAQVVLNSATWIFDAPSNFSKTLFNCRDSSMNKVHICSSIDRLDDLDIAHTAIADHITHIAVDLSDNSFCVYPKATETIFAWFYQKPNELVNPTDEPSCIPVAFRERVILPKVIIKNYRILQDLIIDAPSASLGYWQSQFANALYGSPKGDIGMLNYFAKLKKPRRHGGRDPLV